MKRSTYIKYANNILAVQNIWYIEYFFCNTEHRLISCQQGKNIKSHFSIRISLEIAFVNEEIGLVILKGLNKMVGQRRGS